MNEALDANDDREAAKKLMTSLDISKGSLQKKIKSVDFFPHGGGPGQIHTFIKVWKKGCFWQFLCIFAF